MENLDDQASLSKGSQEFFETVCEPCNESDNVLIKAEGFCITCKEYICKSCIQSHKRMKLLKDHQIQGLDEMLKTTPLQETKESIISFKEEIKTECKEHKGENIRYYCKSHKVVGCVDCITLTHRSCADIKRVPDASIDASVATELEEFYQRLKNIAEGVQNLIHLAENNNLQVEDQMVKLLQDIGKYKESIIETFDNLSNQIETQVRSKISEDQGKIDQLVKRCESLKEDVERTSKEFENLRKFNRKNTEFIRMNQSQLQLAEWEKEWNDLNAITKPNQYEFCPDLELRHAMRKMSELGQLMERIDAELCIDCKTMSAKKHILNFSCGHGICEICKDGSMMKDYTSLVCGECTIHCKICKAAVDKSNTSVLVCGHCVCLPCKEKEDMAPCTDCGLITVHCKICKSAVDKSNTSALACRHCVCLPCKKKEEMAPCTDCGLITVHCKICKAAVDKSNTSVLVCGHRVCLPCKKKEDMAPCTDCGLITVHCKCCNAAVDKTNTSALACGHNVCLPCKKLTEMTTCSACGLITVHCKRCNAAVDKSKTSILACGHFVCLPCRRQWRMDPCIACGLITGNQPPGSLHEWTDEENGAPIEVLDFSFPQGTQEPYHPYPGKAYRGGKVKFRLRKCDGDVTQMLKTAFDRKLICRIKQGKIKSNFQWYNGDIVQEWHASGYSYNRASTDEYEEYVGRLKDRLKEFGIES